VAQLCFFKTFGWKSGKAIAFATPYDVDDELGVTLRIGSKADSRRQMTIWMTPEQAQSLGYLLLETAAEAITGRCEHDRM
jgi:hypothetical protein